MAWVKIKWCIVMSAAAHRGPKCGLCPDAGAHAGCLAPLSRLGPAADLGHFLCDLPDLSRLLLSWSGTCSLAGTCSEQCTTAETVTSPQRNCSQWVGRSRAGKAGYGWMEEVWRTGWVELITLQRDKAVQRVTKLLLTLPLASKNSFNKLETHDYLKI